MISAELEARIRRLFHAEAWPVGTIARQLGVHHSTVRRVLAKGGVPAEAFATRRSKADPFLPFMLQVLTQYPDLRASRLYEMVRERGYDGGPDHFRAIVARHRPRKPAEAFLRLSTLPGEQAQVDWGHFGHVEVDGARRPLVAFVMVLSWSRWMILRFGVDQRMGSFLGHHAAAFEALEGVPRVLLYDNLKSAVTQRIGDAIVFNETLLAFAAHHRYEPRPVAPYRGNEKGRVERGIRDVRESFFPARTWTDLEDLNRQAERWCREIRGARKHPEDRTRTVAEAFTEERTKLRTLPDDAFPIEDRVDARVGKTPYVRFDGNDYSVPHDRVRRTLGVAATSDTVRVLDGLEVVAVHRRSWGKGCQIEEPAHIAALATRKAEARQERGMNRLFVSVPEARPFIERMAERGGNIGGAVAILGGLLDAFGAKELGVALDEALAADALHVAAVRQILDRRRLDTGKPTPIAVALPDDPRVRDVTVRQRPLNAYDALKGMKGNEHG
ncbi:MAG: IS21 family transposase [Planctomycetes bacterium]|nr:IS21 family transposase [Myxococcales bacterium]MCB9902736.1 IS21 family transposase [Planctomycetota bacterium]